MIMIEHQFHLDAILIICGAHVNECETVYGDLIVLIDAAITIFTLVDYQIVVNWYYWHVEFGSDMLLDSRIPTFRKKKSVELKNV